MQFFDARFRSVVSFKAGTAQWLGMLAAIASVGVTSPVVAAETTPTADPVLSLMLEKGMVTEAEAARVQAQVDARRTNQTAVFPESKWKISDGIKDIELFGDVRLRYEGRTAQDPAGGEINLDRMRYAIRLGVRGNAFDDFYYGFRLETSSNPRSSWVTMGTSSSGTPYQGPFGKSTAGVNIGQAYLGWHPETWFDITLGKMPNPLYVSTMVWNPSLNPEGAAEHFKTTVGEADIFANLGQFLYQDTNPTGSARGYFNLNGSDYSFGSLPFLMTWQGGVDYHLTKNVSLKVAPTLYSYTRFNQGQMPINNGSARTPDFAGTYVGQGSTSGILYPAFYNLANGTPGFDGFYANQTGINNLLVLDFPIELNIKLKRLDVRLFGDYAQNLQGATRANAAYNAASSTYFSSPPLGQAGSLSNITAPQTHDNAAYQLGLALGSKDAIGLVSGSAAKARKHAWEVRTYWQHIEQYSLDPNLLDTDFFEGVENLEGIYAAAAYSLTDNFIGTVRYGHANRINNLLGTGGSGQDIPQINPVNAFEMFQVDLTYKF